MRNTSLILAGALALAGCPYELESPAPDLDGIAPALVCNEQLVTTIEVSGANFTPLPSDVLTDDPVLILPALALTQSAGPDGTPTTGEVVPVDGTTHWHDEGEMHFDVDPELALTPGVYDLDVTNPDDQTAHLDAVLQAVPAPEVDGVAPEVFCVDEGPQTLTLSGRGFLAVGTTLPTVHIGDLDVTADALSDCFDLGGPVEGRSCETLTFTVPQDGLPIGVHDISVTNPETAACTSEETVQAQVVPPPVLDTIVEELVCDAQSESLTFTLTGSEFLELDGTLPTVHFGAFSQVADSIGGTCESLAVGDGQSCTELTITIPPSLDEGVLPVSVTNPAPAACSSGDLAIENLPPPVVTDLVPSQICTEAGDTPIDVVGGGFLFIDGDAPVVDIGGETYTPVEDPTTCTDLAGPAGGKVCTLMTIEVLAGTFDAVADEPVLVTNPAPADCDSRDDDVTLAITPPPVISGVEPLKVCGGGNDVTITGTDFADEVTVSAGGRDLTVVSVTQGVEDVIVATFPVDMEPGFYQIEIANPDGCSDVWGDEEGEELVEVTKLPIVFFADPEVIYQPVSIQSKVYVTGINTIGPPTVGVTDVTLTDPSGVDHVVPEEDWTWSEDQPNRLFLTLDAGLDLGAWDVTITDAAACDATLEDAFTVTDQHPVVIDAVTPEFGWDDAYTPVEITSDPEPDGDFQDVPRLFLSPAGDTGAVATEVFAVSYQSASLIDAVVPIGLTPGFYDLLVINPDNTIGYEAAIFEVTDDSPPVIEFVSPGSVPNNATTDLTLTGQYFPTTVHTDTDWDAAVYLDCQDPSDGSPFDRIGPLFPTTAPTSAEVVVAFDPKNGPSPNGTVDVSGGAVCVVVLYDRTAETFDQIPSVSVTNPSENLYSWKSGTSMEVGRRAPAVVAGRATRTNRYLYAIGGEDGAGVPMTSIEWARIGRFGDLGDWFLPYDPDTDPNPYTTEVYLPAARSMAASTVIGRFVYLVGGFGDEATVAGGPESTAWRAQILDPLDAPRIQDIAVDIPDDDSGIEGGRWIYRVSALYASDDDDNPSGESLPGDPFVVRLPDTFGNLVIELSWDPPADSSPDGYRVYRTPAPGSASGTEEWLADVTGTTYTDDGQDPDTGSDLYQGIPLPRGALGRWHVIDLPVDADVQVDPLPRQAPCVAWGLDPGDDETAWLYMMGGLSVDDGGAPAVRGDIRALEIDLAGEHDQEVVGWLAGEPAAGTDSLGPRWQCRGVTVTNRLHSLVTPGDTFTYFVGGADNVAGTATADPPVVGRVGADGAYADFYELDKDPGFYAGTGIAAANNRVYVFTGFGADITTNAKSGPICGSDGGGGDVHDCTNVPNMPPYITRWDADTSPLIGRYLAGSAQESSAIFLVGGETNASTASTVVEWTNY